METHSHACGKLGSVATRPAHLPILLACIPSLAACSTSYKPCTEAGEIAWVNPIKGNMQCTQKKRPDGTYVNHGKFIHWNENGKVALEGDMKDGKKDGVWIQYDDEGKKILEKTYINGVETPPSAPIPPTIPAPVNPQ